MELVRAVEIHRLDGHANYYYPADNYVITNFIKTFRLIIIDIKTNYKELINEN